MPGVSVSEQLNWSRKTEPSSRLIVPSLLPIPSARGSLHTRVPSRCQLSRGRPPQPRPFREVQDCAGAKHRVTKDAVLRSMRFLGIGQLG
jgi:hypothetical protein